MGMLALMQNSTLHLEFSGAQFSRDQGNYSGVKQTKTNYVREAVVTLLIIQRVPAPQVRVLMSKTRSEGRKEEPVGAGWN